jgi:hypothetical protein
MHVYYDMYLHQQGTQRRVWERELDAGLLQDLLFDRRDVIAPEGGADVPDHSEFRDMEDHHDNQHYWTFEDTVNFRVVYMIIYIYTRAREIHI